MFYFPFFLALRSRGNVKRASELSPLNFPGIKNAPLDITIEECIFTIILRYNIG